MCYQAGKGENLQRKPFFWLVKKFCGLFSNWRSISQNFRGGSSMAEGRKLDHASPFSALCMQRKVELEIPLMKNA